MYRLSVDSCVAITPVKAQAISICLKSSLLIFLQSFPFHPIPRKYNWMTLGVQYSGSEYQQPSKAPRPPSP